ncbi:hypothetical protein GCM10023094_49480 [Rhodococcus olei]|uniref:Uncharacterized protein n=1 Tax=Rhodococcus olei TaxID=2161675 RepID=A0ABP8PNN6_9NOCA
MFVVSPFGERGAPIVYKLLVSLAGSGDRFGSGHQPARITGWIAVGPRSPSAPGPLTKKPRIRTRTAGLVG